MSKCNALVLAGRRGPTDPLAVSANVSHKALVPVAGRPMLARVLDTLTSLPEIGRIAVIGEAPDTMLREPTIAVHSARFQFLEAAASPSLSVLRALEALPAPYPLLVTTADHPLLTGAMIRYFLNHQPDCHLSAALARSETIRAAYPETRRTYLRFRDGRFSGCNLFMVSAPEAHRAVAFWRRIEIDRKQPWRMIRHLGLLPLASFALGRLSLAAALELLGRRIGVRLGIVELPFAEAAIDVDKPSDLSLAEKILLGRNRSLGSDR